MKRLLLAAVGAASLGLFAAGSASAAPLGSAAAGIDSARSAVPFTENVAWRKVCRTRNVWRHDRWGHPVRAQVRDCDRVWVGPPRDHRPPPGYGPGPGWGPPPPRY